MSYRLIYISIARFLLLSLLLPSCFNSSPLPFSPITENTAPHKQCSNRKPIDTTPQGYKISLCGNSKCLEAVVKDVSGHLHNTYILKVYVQKNLDLAQDF